MKVLAMFVIGALSALAATPFARQSSADCNGCGTTQNSATPTADTSIEVVGVLTNEGIECQALRADSGGLYTLNGNFNGFRNGDRVVVAGQVADFSYCQQGTTINVSSIAPAM